MHFNGTKVEVIDENECKLKLFPSHGPKDEQGNPKAEIYKIETPDLVIGNLLLPSRFIEAKGTTRIENVTLGITADLTFH